MTTSIVALASPPGTGAVSLIRLSGPDSKRILSRCWKGRSIQHWTPRQAILGEILEQNGEGIDQVLLTWFEAPNSFTGEDIVEIGCHGGKLISSLIIERLIECGANPAQPGEFSQRAFLNGKLDLTQAEAIMELISARSQLALKAAKSQLSGSLSQHIQQITQNVKWATAMIEAHINFPEEDISPETISKITQKTNETISQIDKLLATEERGKFLRQGIPVAIIGKPNAGKSSLLNLLLGYNRAIVSDIAGTTRDTIEEELNIQGALFRLIDTAGLRDSSDEIERQGIERTHQALEQAELILHVVDSSAEISEISPTIGVPSILVLNKADLRGNNTSWENLAASKGFSQIISMSCTANNSHSELEKLHNAMLSSIHFDPETWTGEWVAVNKRHAQALRNAKLSLIQTEEQLLADPDHLEFAVIGLYEAINELGTITGRIDRDDILGVIFQQFCIGK